MSIYREENPYDGSIINRGMTEEDWRRLHGRVVPNLLPLTDFKAAALEGRIHDSYLAKDLHKIMQEMRDILKEHGELREAANLPLSGKKEVLGKAVAAAVHVVDGTPTPPLPAPGPLPHRGPTSGCPSSSSAAAGEGGEEALVHERLSASPLVEQSPTDSDRAPTSSLSTTPGKNKCRPPPFTDHILDAGALPSSFVDALSTSTIPPRTTTASAPSTEHYSRPRSVNNRTWHMNTELSRIVAQNASRELSPPNDTRENGGASVPARDLGRGGTALPPAVAEKIHSIATVSPSLSLQQQNAAGAAPTVAPSTGAKNELTILNERSPPFFQLLSVVRRFQLRYGSHPMKFEVPIQYAQAIATRRVRVHVIPVRHPNVPSRWPVAKEIVVYVNDQCITTPWRRSWPERKEEVAKTYLPLDITQLLNRTQPQQRIQIDIFNKEYFTPALLAVVQPFTLEEVVESVLERELGEAQLSKIQAKLLSDPPTSPSLGTSRLADSDAAAMRFYQRVMEDDVDEGVEVDDPIITTKCPISQMPIEIPVRGQQCGHLQCVDLQSYLVSCHKGSYWNCALCDRELRPSGITVDTILWRFLRSATARGGVVPQHLRLSIRPPDAVSEGSTSVAARCEKYYWHPSRGENGDTDVLVDDDDDDDDQGPKGESENGVRHDEEDEAAVAQREQLLYLTARGVEERAALPFGATSGVKRSREPSPPRPMEGSCDNPIEL